MYFMTKEGITFLVNGADYFVPKNHMKYEEIVELTKSGFDEEIFMELYNSSPREVEQDGLLYEDGFVYYVENGEKWQLDEYLQEEVELRNTADLPMEPIVNFCRNLFQNPSYDARRRTFRFLKNKNMPITDDGHFLTYKGVHGDYYDKHSRSIHYGIGKTITLDRKLCDDNPNNACSSGLHVGSLQYATNWSDITIVCKVNPRDVVTVPAQEEEKMRVCELYVVEDYKTPLDRAVDNKGNGINEVQEYEGRTFINPEDIKVGMSISFSDFDDVERIGEVYQVDEEGFAIYLDEDDENYNYGLSPSQNWEYFENTEVSYIQLEN